jgi:hypothetical protein
MSAWLARKSNTSGRTCFWSCNPKVPEGSARRASRLTTTPEVRLTDAEVALAPAATGSWVRLNLEHFHPDLTQRVR